MAAVRLSAPLIFMIIVIDVALQDEAPIFDRMCCHCLIEGRECMQSSHK